MDIGIVVGLLLGGLSIITDHVLKKPQFGDSATGRNRFVRMALISVYIPVMVLILIFLLGLIWFIPQYIFFDLGNAMPEGALSIALILFLVFLLCATSWHYLFYCFPVLMVTLTRVFLWTNDISAFPRLIDYAYYLFGTVGILYGFLDITGGTELSLDAKLFYLTIAMQIFSLRFTKITIDGNDKYLKSTVNVRSMEGTTLVKRNVGHKK